MYQFDTVGIAWIIDDGWRCQHSHIHLAQKASICPSAARSIYSTSTVAGLMKAACRWLVGGSTNHCYSAMGATLQWNEPRLLFEQALLCHGSYSLNRLLDDVLWEMTGTVTNNSHTFFKQKRINTFPFPTFFN